MRQSVHSEQKFRTLVELIRCADVAYTNLETTLHNFQGYPSARWAGPYLCSNPIMIEELKWMGFNLFSCANNHATDYSEGGLLATMATLDQARVTYAGIGINLEAARSPAYLETKKGRVALISAASETFGRAGPARKDMQGRPGFNPLRFDVHYVVDGKTIASLKKIADDLGLLKVYSEPSEYYFLDNRFVEGTNLGIHSATHKVDAQGNLESIRKARFQSDWILFAHHCHPGRSGRNDQIPAEFMEDFAHKCINEGVNAFIAHGYHALRGIEIYKGRPIFYGLGNFIEQSDTVEKQPAEFYEYLGLDPYLALPSDIIEDNAKEVSGRRPAEWSYEKKSQWESAVACMRFKGDRVQELTLHPISLGYDLPKSQRGRPTLADKPLANKILSKLRELSKIYDTRIDVRDGIGKIRL